MQSVGVFILVVAIAYLIVSFSAFVGSRLLHLENDTMKRGFLYGLFVLIIAIVIGLLSYLTATYAIWGLFIVVILGFVAIFRTVGYLYDLDFVESMGTYFIFKFIELGVTLLIFVIAFSVLVSFGQTWFGDLLNTPGLNPSTSLSPLGTGTTDYSNFLKDLPNIQE